MINARKFGGGYFPHIISERRQGSVNLFPLRLPKGGQRWNNISLIGGGIDG